MMFAFIKTVRVVVTQSNHAQVAHSGIIRNDQELLNQIIVTHTKLNFILWDTDPDDVTTVVLETRQSIHLPRQLSRSMNR